jgi:hypothetical protein
MSTIQEALRIDHRIGSVSIRPFMDALGILRLQVKTQIGCIRDRRFSIVLKLHRPRQRLHPLLAPTYPQLVFGNEFTGRLIQAAEHDLGFGIGHREDPSARHNSCRSCGLRGWRTLPSSRMRSVAKWRMPKRKIR